MIPSVCFSVFLSQACYRSSFPAGRQVNNSHVYMYQHWDQASPTSLRFGLNFKAIPSLWTLLWLASETACRENKQKTKMFSRHFAREGQKKVGVGSIFLSEIFPLAHDSAISCPHWSQHSTIPLLTSLLKSFPEEAAKQLSQVFAFLFFVWLLLSEQSLGF